MTSPAFVLRIAHERGDVEEIGRAYVNLGETLDWAGRVEEAAATARQGTVTAIEQGIGSVAALLASDHALRLLRLGRWDEADAVLATGLDVAVGGVTAGAALGVRALLDVLRGRFDEATDSIEEADRAQEHAVGSMGTGPVAITHAELALWRGAPADARAAIVAMLDSLDPGDEDAFYLSPALGEALVARADHLVRAEAFPAGRCPPEAELNAATAAAEHARATAPPPRRPGATSPRAGRPSAPPTPPPMRAGATPRPSSARAARAPRPRPHWRRPM